MTKHDTPWDMKRLTILVTVTAIVLLVSFAFLFFGTVGGFYTEAQENGDYYYMSNVHGYSMYPYMVDGDAAIVMDTSHPDFSIDMYDVVVYWWEPEDIYVAHRVIAIRNIDSNPHYYVKGDNNPSYDVDFITEDDITGKVVRVADNSFKKWCYEVIL